MLKNKQKSTISLPNANNAKAQRMLSLCRQTKYASLIICNNTNDSLLSLQGDSLSTFHTRLRSGVSCTTDALQPEKLAEGHWNKAQTTITVLNQPDRQRAVSFAAVHLSLGHRVPAEVEFPVEASIGHVGSCHVLKRIIADHINDRAYHCSPAANRNANTWAHKTPYKLRTKCSFASSTSRTKYI